MGYFDYDPYDPNKTIPVNYTDPNQNGSPNYQTLHDMTSPLPNGSYIYYTTPNYPISKPNKKKESLQTALIIFFIAVAIISSVTAAIMVITNNNAHEKESIVSYAEPSDDKTDSKTTTTIENSTKPTTTTTKPTTTTGTPWYKSDPDIINDIAYKADRYGESIGFSCSDYWDTYDKVFKASNYKSSDSMLKAIKDYLYSRRNKGYDGFFIAQISDTEIMVVTFYLPDWTE